MAAAGAFAARIWLVGEARSIEGSNVSWDKVLVTLLIGFIVFPWLGIFRKKS